MNTLNKRTQDTRSQPIITKMGSEVHVGALHKIQKHLRSEGDALLRMENEGGASLSLIQSTKVDNFFKISKRIRREFPIPKTPTH